MRTNDEIINLMDQLRKEKNISLSELARNVGMAKSALSRYFNKTRQFPLNRVDEFSAALGVTSEYILGVLPVDDNSQDIDNLISTYNKLSYSGKKLVSNFAEKVYQSESSSSNTPSEDIDTLAAHSSNPDKERSMEEIEFIKNYLDNLANEYDKNHSK